LFSHVVAHNPEARDAHLNLGSALFDEDRYDEGLAATRIAVEQRPDSAGALANLGRALIHFGRLQEAEEHLRRAVEVDPRSTTAHQNLAETLRKQERFADAVESYRAVLAIDEGHRAFAYAGMGMALFGAGRYAEALDATAEALSLQPELPNAAMLYVHMGRSARELGRLDEAAAHFERGTVVDPHDVEPLLELADVRVRQGRSEEGERILADVLERRSGDPASVHRVAETLRTWGRHEKAIASYRAALRADADFAPSYAGLGIALFQTERYEEAIEALQRALALQPDLSIAGSSLRVFLGRAAQRLGRPDAAEHFARAVRDDPSDYEALDHLASVRFGQERYQDALALYQTMTELDPDNAMTHSNLGAALFHLGRLEEALISVERALALDPDLEAARIGLRAVHDAQARPQR
ncbi:MAG: tetratricopeptide repeat protein, partial [Spirochaetaceae bacterium]|nr:tetratricopeptide repeat protein [Spirochaetaceae bacterium]